MVNSRTIVFLGKSGSGKDTQAEILAEKLKPSLLVSTGDLAREIMESNTLIGKRVKETLAEGGLLPAWLASFLWEKKLAGEFVGEENLIFPSSPRRVPEAKEIDEVIKWLGRDGKVEAVLVDIPDEEVFTRLLKRGRADDTKENIQERLNWFKRDVEPVIDYYEKDSRLYRVDGVGPVEEIAKRIDKALII